MKYLTKNFSLQSQVDNLTNGVTKLPSISKNPRTCNFNYLRSASLQYSDSNLRRQYEIAQRRNSRNLSSKVHPKAGLFKSRKPSKFSSQNEGNKRKKSEQKLERITRQTSLVHQRSPSYGLDGSHCFGWKSEISLPVESSKRSSGQKVKHNSKIVRGVNFRIKVGQSSQTTNSSSLKVIKSIHRFKQAHNHFKQNSEKAQSNPNQPHIMSVRTNEEEINNLGSVELHLDDPKLPLGKDNKTTHSEPNMNKFKNNSLTRTSVLETDKYSSSKLYSEVGKREALLDICDNSDLDIVYPCKDFIAILASSLALLDCSLSHPGVKVDQFKDRKELRKLKYSYKKFISQFIRVGQIRNNVFIYSLILAKKVKEIVAKKFQFHAGEFLLIYIGCLFLSIKVTLDTEKWFLEDFSEVSGIEPSIIEKMELFIFDDILNFNVSISSILYREEHLRIYKNVQKRILLKKSPKAQQ